MTSAGAWGKVRRTESGVCSLSDVMSEQLATELQQKEDETAKKLREKEELAANAEKELMRSLSMSDSKDVDDGDTSKDLELALMLQAQFDAELVESQQRNEESKKNEKVVLNFSYSTDEAKMDSDEDTDSDNEDEAAGDTSQRRRGPSFSCSATKGYSGSGANIRTKHDLEVAGRRNADRILDFMDPTFRSGDVEAGDHRFSDPVYNGLRRAYSSDQRRTVRLQEKKDHSTVERAVDERTRRTLYHLETQDRLRELGGVIATGKESVVLYARGGAAWTPQGVQFPEECAVKIYKTTLNEFKTRVIYVNGDFRFSKDEFRKQNPRKVIRMWAEKEMMNLKKIHKHGILCPKAIQLTKHVLVMSFIGRNGHPAPQLTDAVLAYEDWQDVYNQTVKIIRGLFEECNLVHADLSQYNLLWHDSRVYVIDVSQSVDRDHPHALSFLRRDCENVSKFFKKKGVHGVADWEDLFNDLTGLGIEGRGDEFLKNFATYLAATKDYEADPHYLTEGVSRREYAFDYFFDLSQAEKAKAAAQAVNDEEQEAQSLPRASASTSGRRE